MSFHRRVARCAAGALVAALLVPLDAAAATAASEPAFVPGGAAVVAGDGYGDGGPATAARLPGTRALAYAPDGDLVIGGYYRVRRVDAETGVITTVAGTTAPGRSADGGLATEAALDVSDVAVAPDGAVHVAEAYEGRVRRVDPVTGTITTVAGGGSSAPATGVAATAASFRPVSIGFGPGGVLYVGSLPASYGDRTAVWRVEPGGLLTRVAGGQGATVTDLAAAPAGADWVVPELTDLTVTPGGDLVYSEAYRGRVIRVAGAGPGGTVTAVVTGATHVNQLAAGPDGSFVVGRFEEGVQRLSAAGALTDVPGGTDCGYHALALRADGGIVATCSAGGGPLRVHAVPGDGTTPHLAGTDSSPDGTPAAAAFFSGLHSATTAPDGTVYFTERWRLRGIGPDGLLRTIAGQVTPGGPAGDGGPAVDAAFGYPTLLAVHPGDASVYVLDGAHVRRVVPGGDVTAVIGGSNDEWTDGSPAAEARVRWIRAMAIDGAGVLHVADDMCRIAKVVDGAIFRVPGPPECTGVLEMTLAFDPAGRVVIGRGGGSYARVERRRADGTWETLDRGGPRLAIGPDGSIETSSRSLRPDGSRWAQSYRLGEYQIGAEVPLAAEPAGTLLAVVSGRLVRLTPALQQPPAAVTGLTVTPGPGTIALGWDPPATAPESYVVEIVPGTVPPPAPDLGRRRAVAPGSATGITLREGGDPYVYPTSFPGLRAGETYAFAVYALGPGGYSPAVTGTAVPQADETPPGEVTNLSVTYVDNRLVATWTRPADEDLYTALPRLTAGTTPAASPADGTRPAPWGDTEAEWWIGPGSGTWTVRVFTSDVYGNAGPSPATVTFVRDAAPPPAVTGLRVTLSGGQVVATWDAPAADVAQVRARALIGGTSYPASPTSGVEPSSSSATGASWASPQYGETYHVAVFTTDADGDTGAATTAAFVPRRPAALTLSRSASTVTYGGRVTLRGVLADQRTGRALGGERVELWRRAKGTTTFAFRAAATTTSDGRVAFTETPPAHVEYRLRHPASAVAAVSSITSAVLVRARVGVTPTSASAPRGTTVHLYAAVAPKHTGVPLTLQRYVGGAWRTVTTLRTGPTGNVRFAVAPATAGTYYYRVTFAGDADHLRATSRTVRVAIT